MSRYNERITSVRFEDAANVGFTIECSEGLTVAAVSEGFAPYQPQYCRGVHDGFTRGQDQVQEISLTVQMKNEALTHATNNRVKDFVRGQNRWKAPSAGGFRTTVDTEPFWCWRCIVTYDDGTTSTSTTYPKCEGERCHSQGDSRLIPRSYRVRLPAAG